jgi:hypothetical protein
VRNPYVAGPVVRPPHFYGRHALVETLLDGRNQNIYLVGNRRVGKTSLMQHVAESSSAIVISLDLMGCKNDAISMGRFLAELVRAKAPTVPVLKKARFGRASDIAEAISALSVVAQHSGVELLLLFDEAEKLLYLDDDSLERLRSALQGSPMVRTIISASKRLNQLHDRCRNWTNSPFLQNFAVFYIPSLDEAEARALILQRYDPGASIQADESTISEIIAATGNHPYLLQRLCYYLFQPEGILRTPVERDFLIDEVLDSTLYQDYVSLSHSERVVLNAVFQANEIDRQRLMPILKINDIELEGYLCNLERLCFLSPSADASYRVANRFLRNWLSINRDMKVPEHVSDFASLKSAYRVLSRSDVSRRHLETQLREAQRNYDTLTERISALDTDIGRATEEFRRQPLKEQRAQLEAERAQRANQRADLERQLTSADSTPDP